MKMTPVSWRLLRLAALTAVGFGAIGWFRIQSLRLAYQSRSLRAERDDLAAREQSVDEQLQRALSLSRLDELGRRRFGLETPGPRQVMVLPPSVSR
jgi:hypothetical protein